MKAMKFRSCTRCNGTGRNAEAPDPTTSCWGCWGEPERIPDNVPDFLPPRDEFGDTHFVGRELGQELADSFAYVVIREDRPGTWAEYNLGVGSLWSSTDYGEAWRKNDDDWLANKVHQHIAETPGQWCKYYDRDTRKKASIIAIKLHHHGYTPIAVVDGRNISASGTMWLPPTYTDELLASNPHQ